MLKAATSSGSSLEPFPLNSVSTTHVRYSWELTHDRQLPCHWSEPHASTHGAASWTPAHGGNQVYKDLATAFLSAAALQKQTDQMLVGWPWFGVSEDSFTLCKSGEGRNNKGLKAGWRVWTLPQMVFVAQGLVGLEHRPECRKGECTFKQKKELLECCYLFLILENEKAVRNKCASSERQVASSVTQLLPVVPQFLLPSGWWGYCFLKHSETSSQLIDNSNSFSLGRNPGFDLFPCKFQRFWQL